MGSLRNVANVKTGLPFFELEREAGILYRTMGMTGTVPTYSIGNGVNYLNALRMSANAPRSLVALFPDSVRR